MTSVQFGHGGQKTSKSPSVQDGADAYIKGLLNQGSKGDQVQFGSATSAEGQAVSEQNNGLLKPLIAIGVAVGAWRLGASKAIRNFFSTIKKDGFMNATKNLGKQIPNWFSKTAAEKKGPVQLDLPGIQ